MSVANPEPDAGALDRRVVLLKPVYNQWQDEIDAWEPAASTWAQIRPAVAQEASDSGRMVMYTQVPVMMRYRTDVDARWRIQDGPHVYEIVSIADPERRQARLELVCREIV